VQIRVRAACNSSIWGPWCGIAGPNSAPYQFFTPVMPTLSIPSYWCNAVIPLYNVYFDVAYVANVDRYYFQKTRVTSAAPYTPIAPPIVVYSSSSGWLLQGATATMPSTANTPGATYRGCFKPSITTCNSPQDGSWGPYCYFAIAPASAPSGMTLLNEEEIATVQVIDETVSENPSEPNIQVFTNGTEKAVVIDMKGREMSTNGRVNFYNINGQLVYTEIIPNSMGVSELQLGIPTDFVDGTYIMQVVSDSFTTNAKMVLTSTFN
jgi:hypothetical protein